ncbi:MAG: septation protein SpoVG family protein [Planctomycetes bacterium]|nr:septation protein SpoVG family protein [Planctomycetota bacterium]
MEISEVNIRLLDSRNDKLRAFCSITIDNAFVVRDLKVIDGAKGIFVAMPSRKITCRCIKCRTKNFVKSNFCNECGTKMVHAIVPDKTGRPKIYADIAHPINSQCRNMIQDKVLAAFHAEKQNSKKEGYKPPVGAVSHDDIED